MTYFLSGGTHGSVKGYRYSTSKYILDSAVKKVLKSNLNIIQDTVIDYYNDGNNYVMIYVKQREIKYRYIFRYYGDSTDWKRSPDLSEIFICYAFDEDGNGGSEGGGELAWYHWKLKKRLIKPFETEFIFRLDSTLHLQHIDAD
jgi:hypothetical protein